MGMHETPSFEIAHSVETEAMRVAAFQETLARATEIRPLEVIIDLHGADPVHDIANQVIAEAYKPGPTVLVNPNFQETVKPGGQFTPYKSRGGKRSMHGVFFGEMQWEDGSSLPVAVKPHATDSRKSCATDYATNVAVDELGLHNLESVGVVLSSDNAETAYSITRLNPGITTLDSINWKYLKTHPEAAPQLATAWSQVARQAAMLHSLGSVSHGDFAPRNIAVGADGGVFPIDWERASLSLQQPRDAEARYGHSRLDIGELMESMVLPAQAPGHVLKTGLGMFDGSTDVWADFKQLVFDEYAQTRVGYVQHDPTALRDVQDELTELANSLQAHLKLIA